MAQTDDIDELVSSVRDFVSHKEPPRTRSRILLDRLILTPELRVPDTEIAERPVNAKPKKRIVGPDEQALPPVQSYDKAGLEATIAELEAAVTAQFDDWEADEGETFGKEAWAASAFPSASGDSAPAADAPSSFAHSTTKNGADAPQSAPVAEPADAATQVDNTVVPQSEDAVVADAVIAGFDEQALRKLVIEIVHDELGGELGERITRNVRKMVRREINRVLTSREMGQG